MSAPLSAHPALAASAALPEQRRCPNNGDSHTRHGTRLPQCSRDTPMPQDAPSYLRPRAVERTFGRLLGFLVRIGLVRGHFYVLEVRGRKSGKTISLLVDLLDFGGRRYLVCARGNSNWVRNARAAGEVALVRGRWRQHYAVLEVPPSMRPPLLKAYLDRYAREVQRFFPGPEGFACRGLQRSGTALSRLRVGGAERIDRITAGRGQQRIGHAGSRHLVHPDPRWVHRGGPKRAMRCRATVRNLTWRRPR